MGVDGEQGFIELPAPSCVKLHGRTYHKISGTTSKWMIHDPLDRNLGAGFSQEIFDTIDAALRRVNPFVNQFEALERYGTENSALILDFNVDSGEIAAIIDKSTELTTDGRTVSRLETRRV